MIKMVKHFDCDFGIPNKIQVLNFFFKNQNKDSKFLIFNFFFVFFELLRDLHTLKPLNQFNTFPGITSIDPQI